MPECGYYAKTIIQEAGLVNCAPFAGSSVTKSAPPVDPQAMCAWKETRGLLEGADFFAKGADFFAEILCCVGGPVSGGGAGVGINYRGRGSKVLLYRGGGELTTQHDSSPSAPSQQQEKPEQQAAAKPEQQETFTDVASPQKQGKRPNGDGGMQLRVSARYSIRFHDENAGRRRYFDWFIGALFVVITVAFWFIF